MPRSIHRLHEVLSKPGGSWSDLSPGERLRWLAECRRLRNNYAVERTLGAPEVFVAGIDETGRGPLAGPVAAAAVILPFGCLIPGLNDSKRLTRSQRDAMYLAICRRALAIGVACRSAPDIDEIGINAANFSAMRRAASRLLIRPGAVIVDGRQMIPGLSLTQRTLIRGDQKSNSVAAASIVAKVVRDRIMIWHHRHYPQYDLVNNVGYSTPAHRRALEEYGATPLHRQSFLHLDSVQQMNLFSE